MIRIPTVVYMTLEDLNALITVGEGKTLEIAERPGAVSAKAEKADTVVGSPM